MILNDDKSKMRFGNNPHSVTPQTSIEGTPLKLKLAIRANRAKRASVKVSLAPVKGLSD